MNLNKDEFYNLVCYLHEVTHFEELENLDEINALYRYGQELMFWHFESDGFRMYAAIMAYCLEYKDVHQWLFDPYEELIETLECIDHWATPKA